MIYFFRVTLKVISCQMNVIMLFEWFGGK